MGPVPGTPRRTVLFHAAVRSAFKGVRWGVAFCQKPGEATRWGWMPGGECLSRGSCPPLSLPGGKHKSVNFA